jgi:ribonuclease HI
MSNAEKLEDEDFRISPEIEEQRRKRAYDIIKKAVRNSVIPLNNREVSHRLLPGLWLATVNILIACLDVKDVMKLLTNRAALLAHAAENSDIPPYALSGPQLSRYAKEVATAGQAITEAIDECIPMLERENLEERLPESVLDCAVFLLINSWGPVHLRRAMVEQVSAFLSGKAAAALFMEPMEQIKLKQEHESASESEADPKPIEAPSLPPRGEKLVRVFSDYRLEGTTGEWAFAIHKSGPGNNEELHVMKGETPDTNGRVTPLVAIVEALKAVSHENAATVVIVETCHHFVLKGMEGHGDEKLAFRHAEEASIWRDIDALVYGRDIRYRALAANLSEPLQHACDMVMKRGVAKLV